MDEPTTIARPVGVPLVVTDLLCPFGHIMDLTQDRRWLWSVHEALTQAAADGTLPPSLAAPLTGLERHLFSTCEHHWEIPVDEADLLDEIERCLWCEIPKPKGSWFGDSTVRP